MDAGSQSEQFTVFFILWLALGMGSAAFFFLSKNAALKRRVWPPFIIVTGLIFGGFVWATSPHVPWFFYLAIVAITLLNLRAVRFCDACGKTNQSSNPFSSVKFCSKCGAKLQ
jgi:hypothetical protein